MKISFFLAMFTAGIFYKETELLCAYLAVILHEGAHGFAAHRLGIKLKKCELGILGAHLYTDKAYFARDKIIVAASGPLLSFVLFIICTIFSKGLFKNLQMMDFFTMVNLSIALINLIPISPLDGAAILKAVLSKYLGIISGGRVFRGISVFFCALFGVFNLVLFIAGVFNPGMLIIFLFVTNGMRKEFFESLIDKKAVLTGEVKSRKKYRYLACDYRAEYLYLAGLISYDYTICAAIFKDGRFIGELSQADIIEGSKKFGALGEINNSVEKRLSL